jgi:phosphate/sulfate permease
MLAAGVNEEEAISRALSKLGDVTEAANLVSHKKRKKVIMNAYAKKVPVSTKHAIGYALSALFILAGLMTAGSVWFGGDRPVAVTSTLLPFALVSVAGFVFSGLTQETKKRYPLSRKRSLFYVASALLITMGIFICLTSLWEEPFIFNFDYEPYGYENLVPRDVKISGMLTGGILPFIAPGLALLIFLIATEKDRRKWAVSK